MFVLCTRHLVLALFKILTIVLQLPVFMSTPTDSSHKCLKAWTHMLLIFVLPVPSTKLSASMHFIHDLINKWLNWWIKFMELTPEMFSADNYSSSKSIHPLFCFIKNRKYVTLSILSTAFQCFCFLLLLHVITSQGCWRTTLKKAKSYIFSRFNPVNFFF